MLERLVFWCGGYFGANELITLKNQNGRLILDYYFYSHEYHRELYPHHHAEWTIERSKRWLSKIEAIHFEDWESKYWEDVCDGEQWVLYYQYEDNSERAISGSNAYPDNWAQFRELMTILAKKLPRVEDANAEEALIQVLRSEETDIGDNKSIVHTSVCNS